MPMVVASATAATPAESELREPQTSRLQTSRPALSVPSQCLALGGSSKSVRTVAVGLYRPVTGAPIARSTTRTRKARPARAIGFSPKPVRTRANGPGVVRTAASCSGVPVPGDATALIAMSAVTDPRVDRGVGQIGQEVADQHGHGVEERGAHEDGVVAEEGGVDAQPSHPRPGEDLLDQHRAADQTRQAESEDRQEGRERVREGVAPNDRPFAQALGAGGPDVVLAR